MKLHLNHHPDSLLIHSWTLGPPGHVMGHVMENAPENNEANHHDRYHIRINDTWYRQSILLTPQSVKPWEVSDVSTLNLAHFEHLAELVMTGANSTSGTPEFGAGIVILGAGKRAIFPQPALTRPLMRHRIGFEVMDTAAACRTYNILAADGRPALAALIA